MCFIILLGTAGCAAATPAPLQPTATAALQPTMIATQETIEAPEESEIESLPEISVTREEITGLSIEFWHVWDGDRGALITDLVNEFNQSNEYGITVQETFSRNLFGEILQAYESGSLPAVAVGHNYHALAWSARGSLVDLTPYLLDSNWGIDPETLKDFYPTFLAQASIGDIQTGLPFYRTAEVLIYNQSLAEDLGFDTPPATPDQLREQVCAANEALRLDEDPNNDSEGGLMLGFEPGALMAWIGAFGGSIEPIEEGDLFAMDNPVNKQAFTFLRALIDDRCAWVPAEQFPHQAFAERRGLIFSSTLPGAQTQAQVMFDNSVGDNWTILPYPSLSSDPITFYSGPDFLLFPVGPEQQLAGWIFSQWMMQAANLQRWSEITGYFPVRQSVFENLQTQPDWILEGSAFPSYPSWPRVQWVMSDFAQVLFAPLTTLADVDTLIFDLDSFVNEIGRMTP